MKSYLKHFITKYIPLLPLQISETYLTVLLLYLGKRRSALEILNFFFMSAVEWFLDRKFCTSLSHKKAAEHQTFVESNWFYEDKMTFIKGRRFSKKKTLPKD